MGEGPRHGGQGCTLGFPGAADGGRGPPPNTSLTVSHLEHVLGLGLACAVVWGPAASWCCGRAWIGRGTVSMRVTLVPSRGFLFFFRGFLLMEPCVEFLAPRAGIKPVPPAVDPWNLNPRTSGAILSLLFSVSCFPRGKSR